MVATNITSEQYQSVLKDFQKKPKCRFTLGEKESVAIADRLRETISLPFLSQEKELTVLLKMVMRIDQHLYEQLPNEIFELAYNLDEGLDDAEAAQLTARLCREAHQELTFPFLSDHLEYYAITFVITLLINAMREGSNITHAIKVTKQPRMMGDNFPYPDII